MSRIVIVGGYGAFGAHAAERLAAEPGLEIVIAGRSLAKAEAHAAALRPKAKAQISCARLDATRAQSDEIGALGARVLINASGPFQAQDYQLARACIAARCHYVDLADARAFVSGIGALDAEARAANVCVISGASSVPGLSSAVAANLAGELDAISEIDIGISPGNSFDPGVATVASILGGVGKPFTRRNGGHDEIAYGWQGLHRYCYANLGRRWMCNVDVPDLDLLPAHYPSLASARFVAGLEVGLFHVGLWGLSWLVRARLVHDLSPLAAPLLKAKRMLGFLGSDEGAMFVTLSGVGADGVKKKLTCTLIARSGHGPYVPAIASVVLARKLAAGNGPAPGARACFGLFTLADFMAAIAGLDITCETSRS